LIRGFETQSVSGRIIQFIQLRVNVILSNSLKRPILRTILTHQAIGVFLEPAFSGCLGMSKKEAALQVLSNPLMMREFLPIIGGHQGERKR